MQMYRAKGKATLGMKSVKESVLNFPSRHKKDEEKKSDNDVAWWTGEGLTKRLSSLQKTSANGEQNTQQQGVVNHTAPQNNKQSGRARWPRRHKTNASSEQETARPAVNVAPKTIHEERPNKKKTSGGAWWEDDGGSEEMAMVEKERDAKKEEDIETEEDIEKEDEVEDKLDEIPRPEAREEESTEMNPNSDQKVDVKADKRSKKKKEKQKRKKQAAPPVPPPAPAPSAPPPAPVAVEASGGGGNWWE
jgi:hypothetical protein